MTRCPHETPWFSRHRVETLEDIFAQESARVIGRVVAHLTCIAQKGSNARGKLLTMLTIKPCVPGDNNAPTGPRKKYGLNCFEYC